MGGEFPITAISGDSGPPIFPLEIDEHDQLGAKGTTRERSVTGRIVHPSRSRTCTAVRYHPEMLRLPDHPQGDPKESVSTAQLGPLHIAPEYGQLLTKRNVF